jgi:hypothetical protein
MRKSELTVENKRILRYEREFGKGNKARSYVSAGVYNPQVLRATENMKTK